MGIKSWRLFMVDALRRALHFLSSNVCEGILKWIQYLKLACDELHAVCPQFNLIMYKVILVMDDILIRFGVAVRRFQL